MELESTEECFECFSFYFTTNLFKNFSSHLLHNYNNLFQKEIWMIHKNFFLVKDAYLLLPSISRTNNFYSNFRIIWWIFS